VRRDRYPHGSPITASSLARLKRVRREHETAGSNPAWLTNHRKTMTIVSRGQQRRVAQRIKSGRLRSDRPGVRVTPRRPKQITSRKVARRGAQPVLKTGPTARLMVRLLHLPPSSAVKFCGSIGEDPGGLISRPQRGATPRPATNLGWVCKRAKQRDCKSRPFKGSEVQIHPPSTTRT
jgi:hypothetical protein